ncbi:class I adenylate-forming enzyme family protein [Desertibacillus haloalkaliphilus]|uniref:class I adenylate-forming enzyme family protein n=1 Tax=Desertibacillus haloalkaliphilus TaxID=1328930 RepID=UPI001C25DCD3|nr:class I adenylate-forming enzyme family protein [Desertibacillus haloalkaliphilus]MBU8908924.1 acyl--CoA ligase [Desertibacillus haloalkaliphilus]
MWTKEDLKGIERENHFKRDVKVYNDRPKNFVEAFRETVEAHPSREALVMGSNRLTYQDMWSVTEHIAGNLYHKYQVRKGDRVALLVGNCIEFSLVFFACAKLGAILIPLNTRLAKAELSFMIKQSGASIVFTDDEFKANLDDELAIDYKFLIGDDDEAFLPYSELVEDRNSYPEVDIDEDDPLYVMFTSGTTGMPKGAVGTHIGVLHSVISYQRIFQTDENDRSLDAVPLFHVTGLVGQLLHFVYIGGTNVLMRRYKGEEFNRLLSEEKITFTFNVPTIYVLMMEHPSFKNYSYESLRTIAYGGAPMSPQTIYQLKEAFPQVELHNAYGATETSSPTTVMPKGYQEKKPSSVGLPIPVIEVKVVGADGPCQPNEVGELWVKGPNVVPSYWGNEAETKKSFVDGYWCSGDMAMIDEDGFVYIMDRMKDMINRGGEKIFSVEVENTLYNHPDILEAAVVGEPDAVFGERVKAVIVPKENAILTEEDVKVFVRNQLADYKTPEIVEFREQLPRNPGGKIIKTELKQTAAKEKKG